MKIKKIHLIIALMAVSAILVLAYSPIKADYFNEVAGEKLLKMGQVSVTEINEADNAQTGSNLENGTTFSRPILITFDDQNGLITASLDGEPYVSGTRLDTNGDHVFIICDNTESETINFLIAIAESQPLDSTSTPDIIVFDNTASTTSSITVETATSSVPEIAVSTTTEMINIIQQDKDALPEAPLAVTNNNPTSTPAENLNLPLTLNNGDVVKGSPSGQIYVIVNGSKKLIKNRLRIANLASIIVDDQMLDQIPNL
jgi:hypothetical protein